MKKMITRCALGLALTAPAWSAHAANVNLNGWLYGNGAVVALSNASGTVNSRAGALRASVKGAGAFDAAPFVTFSLEYGTDLRFGANLGGYSLVAGDSYFERRQGDAGIAEQIARLMTYADDHGGLVNDANGSASLQLAIWGAIQTHAQGPSSAAAVKTDLTANNALAQSLLAGAGDLVVSRYDVWVLERGTSPDLLLLSARAPLAPLSQSVPEPGSWALAATALAGLGLTTRRRSRHLQPSTAS